MQSLLAVSGYIDRMNRALGKLAILLVLIAALVSAFNAAFRYSIGAILYLTDEGRAYPALQHLLSWYGNNSNSFLEAQWYMFGAIVLLGAGHTLKMNGHVRVDLFYGWVSERTRTWIDLLGAIFCLVPMCLVLIWFTWPWFLDSWRTGEMSTNAGGLPRWPVKLLLPAGFFLVLLQGISEIIKCVAALTTDYVREHAYEKPLQ
jgi:TRAP-type mannitol/chloroaromatic compound transport system permease small subunit